MTKKFSLGKISASVILSVFILIGNPNYTFAADTTPAKPTASTNVNSITNVSNAYDVSTTTYAVLDSSTDVATYTNFNISVPAGATIDTVKVTVSGKRESTGGGETARQLTLAVSSDGTNFSNTQTTNFGTTDSTANFTGATSKWGLSWTPTSFNSNNFKVRVGAISATTNRDVSLGDLTVTVSYTPAVLSTPSVEITPASLPAGMVSTSYNQTLTASTTAVGPFTWSLASGSLPAGLTLNTSATGNTTTISGTPSASSTSTFSVKVTNGTSSTTKSYTINITPLSAPACSISGGTNKISNPCFETGSGNTAPPWVADPSTLVGSSTLSIVTLNTHSGTRAAQIAITNYTSGDAKWVHQSVAVTPGQYYTFSDWYKSDVATEVNVVYNGTDFRWVSSVPPSANWAQYQTSFIVPAGVTSVQVLHILSSNGTLTTDDHSLVQSSAPVFPEGRVSLTFDDGWKSFFTNGVPILNAAGLKASAYINTDPVALSYVGYMNTTDVVSLAAQGYDIGGHTTSHADLTLPATNLNVQINDNRAYLKSLAPSAAVDTFAYPYGAYNDTVISQLQGTQYIGARTVDEGYNFTNSDKFKLKIQHVTNVTSTSTIQSWINQALTDKTWLILMFHEIVGNNGVGGDCIGSDTTECATTAVLQATANYLVQNNVCVLTMTDALHDVPCNKAPVLDAIGNKSISVNSNLTFTAHATDQNAGDTLNYSLTAFPAGATIASTTGVFSWTPVNAQVGTTTITVKVSDNKGATDSESIVVTVSPDTVPPTVTLSTSASTTTSLSLIPVTVLFSENVTGFTESDTTSSIANATLSGFTGTGANYSFNLSPIADGVVSVSIPASVANDLGNLSLPNTASNLLSVTSDRTKPVITLVGNSVIALTTVDSYVEEGATAVDSLSGAVSVVITGTVNTALPGTYVVHYNATDEAGNAAVEVTRTVNVSDSSAPTFENVPADSIIEATDSSGAVSNYTPPTANDAVDGAVAVTCTPASGSTFPLGETVVSCSAADLSGNTGHTSFKVTVRDTAAPTITAPADETLEATAALSTLNLTMAVATDTADGAPVVTYTPSVFPVGTTTVSWKAKDASGNESVAATSVVTVVDTTAPEISNADPMEIEVDTPFVSPVTAFDLVDGDLTANLVIGGLPINTGVLGPKTITYNISDSRGNAAPEKTLTVTVVPHPVQPTSGGRVRSNGGGGSSGRPRISTTTDDVDSGIVLGASTFKFTLDTSIGSAGNEVTELQKRLTSEKVYSGPISGYFGVLTEAGVKAYQTKYGVEPVGKVGPKTRAKLNGEVTVITPDLGNLTIDQMKALLVQLQQELADLLKKAGNVTRL